MNSKQFFIDKIIEEMIAKVGDIPLRLLDLGCGTASYMPLLLQKYPKLEYVGLEPIVASYNKAVISLQSFPQAKTYLQLGYGEIEGVPKKTFDIVISMSVLEHVKNLDSFLEMSAEYVKVEGVLVHRYDLGHALYPHTLKAKIHVWLGNNFPAILPERQFVKYVSESDVKNLYIKHGVVPFTTTYHQLPSQKKLEKHVRALGVSDIFNEVYGWEWKNQDVFRRISLPYREELFPSVAVWGKKA